MIKKSDEFLKIIPSLTMKDFMGIIDGLCKERHIPNDMSIEVLLDNNHHYQNFSHHELDILDGGYLLEEEDLLEDAKDIYKMTISEIKGLLDTFFVAEAA